MECENLRIKLEKLGHIIIENMQFEDVEHIFLEKDYRDRTCLIIITSVDIKQFIVK